VLKNREFARQQIRRLSGLAFFPQEPEAIGELIDALLTAPNETAAADFVRDWLRVEVECPKPAHIHTAFNPPSVAPFKSVAEYACAACSDTGWNIVERAGAEYAQPCVCRKREKGNEL
jgi:hypothetical protein